MAETIYFDTCALNRLTDDLTQPRVLAEARAVDEVFRSVLLGTAQWITSTAVRTELAANPLAEKREQSLPLLDFAHHELQPQPTDRIRAAALQQAGWTHSMPFTSPFASVPPSSSCSPSMIAFCAEPRVCAPPAILRSSIR